MIGNSESNAILSEYSPSGAGKLTSKGTAFRGIECSQYLAKLDHDRALQIADRFLNAADEYDLPPALLIGIASRESRIGWLLDDAGWGDIGRAFGIMQIDHRSHTVLGRPDPRSQAHINQAACIVSDNLVKIRRRHSDWPAARQLQGAVAAYNFGVKNVCTLEGIDKGTTHDDYSNDVWARGLYFAGL
jgi:hypothetical protein